MQVYFLVEIFSTNLTFDNTIRCELDDHALKEIYIIRYTKCRVQNCTTRALNTFGIMAGACAVHFVGRRPGVLC